MLPLCHLVMTMAFGGRRVRTNEPARSYRDSYPSSRNTWRSRASRTRSAARIIATAATAAGAAAGLIRLHIASTTASTRIRTSGIEGRRKRRNDQSSNTAYGRYNATLTRKKEAKSAVSGPGNRIGAAAASVQAWVSVSDNHDTYLAAFAPTWLSEKRAARDP